MKKVTDLGENEGILCRSEEEAKAICQLMHNAGLKWVTDKSYLDNSMGFISKYEVYNPAKGSRESIGYANKKLWKIHPASDFLEKTYEVSREQLRKIAEDKPHLVCFCKDFIKDYFGWFGDVKEFKMEEVFDIFKEAENSLEEELLKLLFPTYEKPKQKKEIEVWVVINPDETRGVYLDKYLAEKVRDINSIIVKLTGTYEI